MGKIWAFYRSQKLAFGGGSRGIFKVKFGSSEGLGT